MQTMGNEVARTNPARDQTSHTTVVAQPTRRTFRSAPHSNFAPTAGHFSSTTHPAINLSPSHSPHKLPPTAKMFKKEYVPTPNNLRKTCS